MSCAHPSLKVLETHHASTCWMMVLCARCDFMMGLKVAFCPFAFGLPLVYRELEDFAEPSRPIGSHRSPKPRKGTAQWLFLTHSGHQALSTFRAWLQSSQASEIYSNMLVLGSELAYPNLFSRTSVTATALTFGQALDSTVAGGFISYERQSKFPQQSYSGGSWILLTWRPHQEL